jgi:LPS-assembly protein
LSTRSWWRGLLAAVAFLPAFGAAVQAQPAPTSPTPVTVGTAGGDVTVIADKLEQVGAENRVIATGNVEITRGRTRLMADRVEINRATGDAVAEGRVIFYDGEDQLTGQRVEYNVKTGTGVVYQGDARAEPHYRVSGEEMERLGESVYRIRKGVFTTCEDDPPSWSFHFDRATADLNDYLYGTGASFWVKNVPLIPFFPFFAAAIRRERQTGFLFPKFGNSSTKGFYGETPFYWAIDDSRDATIAPLFYSKRGGGFRGEFRHIEGPEDRGHEDVFFIQENGKEGSRFTGVIREDRLLAPRTWLRIDANGVSDDNVIRDYGDSILQRSTQRVESNVFVTKSWDTWNLVGDLFVYQDLSTARPVELWRLPDISLIGTRQPIWRDSGLLFQSSASFVNFVREVGSSGMRFDVNPQLSRPIPLGYLTLTPFVGGRLTGYDRTVTGTHIGRGDVLIEDTKDEARLRRLVEAGVDVETKLSRVFNTGGWWGTEALLHTIEPRVRYISVTGWDQDHLPQWTDIDNIADASRIEYSLTNRVRARTAAYADSEPVRWEMLRLTVGHSYDTRFEQVGDVFGTLIMQPKPGLAFRSDANYTPVTGHIRNATADVSTTLLPRSTTASLGIRYSDAPGHITFLQGTLLAPLTDRIIVRSTINWDLYRGDFTETRLAADIRWQCWALTIEYVNRPRQDDEVRFAVNLLGVGGPIGTSVGLGSITSGGLK